LGGGGGGSGVPMSPSGSSPMSGSPWARSSGPRRGMALQVRPVVLALLHATGSVSAAVYLAPPCSAR
jgi:hypothetical protein